MNFQAVQISSKGQRLY